MRVSKVGVLSGLFGFAAVVVALGLLAGGAVSSSPMASGAGGPRVANIPIQNTSQNFSFSSPSPTWNSGNLCTPVVSGSVESCTYNGGGFGTHGFGGTGSQCGCSTPLTYNFSGANLAVIVNISNTHDQPVYLNFVGHNDSFLVELSGCQGGTLNITVQSQTNFTLDISASSVQAWVHLYSDADHYFSNISGHHVSVWTYFVSARPKYNECPSSNDTKSDSWSLNVTGSKDFQGLEFVNGVGYSTASNLLSTGNWNSVSFENTTNFVCSWSWAPASNCHHSWGAAAVAAAGRIEE